MAATGTFPFCTPGYRESRDFRHGITFLNQHGSPEDIWSGYVNSGLTWNVGF
jgi:hypothetical protein